MKEQEEDFLKHIQEELQAQEDPYQQGAWEQFLLHEKKKNRKIVPLFSAGFKMAIAATTLLIVGLFGYFLLKDNAEIHNTNTAGIAQQNQTNKKENNQIKTDDATLEKPLIHEPSAKSTLFAKKATYKNKTIVINNTVHTPAKNETNHPNIAVDSTVNVAIAKQEDNQKEAIAPSQKNNKPANTKPQQSIVDWAQNNPVTTQQYESKWSPSFYLAPIMNDAGIHLNFGVGLDFKVNQKFIISSGIEYAKLASEVNTNTPMPAQNNPAVMAKSNTVNRAAANNSAATNYQLNNSVSGINIPLNITYKVSGKLYATTGLSGLVVLANKGNISYTTVNNERITVNTNKGQIIEEKNITFSNTVTGNDLQYHTNSNGSLNSAINSFTPQKNNSIIPFYNAAIGIKQPLGKNKSIALEPFIQIPLIQNNTSQYTGGGIRLKVNL